MATRICYHPRRTDRRQRALQQRKQEVAKWKQALTVSSDEYRGIDIPAKITSAETDIKNLERKLSLVRDVDTE